MADAAATVELNPRSQVETLPLEFLSPHCCGLRILIQWDMSLQKSVVFLFAMFFTGHIFADQQSRDAVKSVQTEMKQSNFGQKASELSPEAKAVAERVKKLAGSPEGEAQIYSLAADILGNMKDMPPEQMEKLMSQAQNDPEGFVNSWTPEQKQKLKTLTERLPANQKVQSRP